MREIVTRVAAIVLVATLASLPAAVPVVAQPSSSEDQLQIGQPASPSLVVASEAWQREIDDVARPNSLAYAPLSTIGFSLAPTTEAERLRLAVAVWCLAKMSPSGTEHVLRSLRAGAWTLATRDMQEEDEDETNVACTGEEVTITITSSSVQACVTNGRCTGKVNGQGMKLEANGTVCLTIDLEPS